MGETSNKKEVSLKLPNNDDDSQKQENLWNKILSEASRSVSDRLDARTMLVLGDRDCGKSSLLARLQGMDIGELGRGMALDYSFIEIQEDDEPVSTINIWQLEGETKHSDLLRFALNETTFADACVLISLDFTKPWELVESLTRWFDILEHHIKTNIFPKIGKETYEELKNSLVYDFQQYIIPEKGAATKQVKKKRPVDVQALLPLDQGVLDKNLGIPIIVALCKTDAMNFLEKEHGYKEAHFDFIFQHLRRICISYGAGLVYTSATKNSNCDVLLQYIRHVLYGFEFNHKPQLLEKEAPFVPIGADSLAKIKLDFENQNLTKDPEEPYEEIIRLPKKLQITETRAISDLVFAEDDQEFLLRLKEANEGAESAEDKAKKKPASKLATNLTAETGSTVTSPSITSALGAVKGPASHSADPAKTDANEHQVLANFFNSLIHKDRSPTGSSAKPSSAELAKGLVASRSSPTAREDVTKQLNLLKNKYKDKDG